MRKNDLIYLNLISLLFELTLESENLITFHDSLEENSQNKLIDISEKISTEKREIINAYTRKEFYPDFTNLRAYITDFEINFSNFQHFRKNELLAIISIIEKLTSEFSGSDALNLEENISHWDFDIIELKEAIEQNNFFQFDIQNITNSIFLFNILDSDSFKDYLNSISSGVKILYFLLGKLGNRESPLTAPKYILVNSAFSSKPKTVWATLCLHIIKTGAIIHKSYEYSLPPTIPTSCSVVLGKNYQQFSDSIDIISEYNSQKDILDKYLRIYHVLENFMYKTPLVKLERDSAGEVFSIRDFKRMYDRINDSELNMLKKLFENVLELEYTPGQTFNSKILTDWSFLIPTFFVDDYKINLLLNILNVTNSRSISIRFNNINTETLPHFIAKLIYAFRNSMVHNRETEFHLTHQNLLSHPIIENAALLLLENFLLPILEETVFYLIINENEIVWYDNSILKLWEKN